MWQRLAMLQIFLSISQNAVQPGDCLDELHGQLIDERWSCRIGELKRKNRGKPITATIVKVNLLHIFYSLYNGSNVAHFASIRKVLATSTVLLKSRKCWNIVLTIYLRI